MGLAALALCIGLGPPVALADCGSCNQTVAVVSVQQPAINLEAWLANNPDAVSGRVEINLSEKNVATAGDIPMVAPEVLHPVICEVRGASHTSQAYNDFLAAIKFKVAILNGPRGIHLPGAFYEIPRSYICV